MMAKRLVELLGGIPLCRTLWQRRHRGPRRVGAHGPVARARGYAMRECWADAMRSSPRPRKWALRGKAGCTDHT